MTERAELALDPPMPPAGMLPRAPEDERVDLGRDRGATTPMRPPVAPRAPDQCAVPAPDRVRRAQGQVPVELTPRAGGQPGERGGQDGAGALLTAREPGRVRALALRRASLVPQHEALAVLVAVARPRAENQVDEERDALREHEPVLYWLIYRQCLP